LNVVKLDINIWTGSKKLRTEDLVLADGSKLPPDELAYLGTKKTIDPDRLKEFNRIKKEAERVCLEVGTRFLGGFANPQDEIPGIIKNLDNLKGEFYQAKNEFLAGYEADTEAWVNKYPEFGNAIRRAIEPVGSVANKLNFDYVVFRVVKPETSANATETIQDESLIRRANSMSEQLFHEIAQDANQLIERSFVGKDTVTARTLSAFRRMRDKLDSLGFLDYRCMPVVDKIDRVLETLPAAGPFNGSAFSDLFALGLLLSDPDKIKRHGSGLLSPSLLPESDEEEAGDQDEPSTLVDEIGVEETQLPTPAPESAPEPAAAILVDAPVVVVDVPVVSDSASQPGIDEDEDDLAGFDDFLSKFTPDSDDSVKVEPVNQGLDLSGSDVFDTDGSANHGLDLSEVQNDPFHSQTPDLVVDTKPAEPVSSLVINKDSDDDSTLDVLLNIKNDELNQETSGSGDFWF